MNQVIVCNFPVGAGLTRAMAAAALAAAPRRCVVALPAALRVVFGNVLFEMLYRQGLTDACAHMRIHSIEALSIADNREFFENARPGVIVAYARGALASERSTLSRRIESYLSQNADARLLLFTE